MKAFAKENEVVNKLTIKKRKPEEGFARHHRDVHKVRLQDWRKREVKHSESPEREGKNIIDKWYLLNEYKAKLFK